MASVDGPAAVARLKAKLNAGNAVQVSELLCVLLDFLDLDEMSVDIMNNDSKHF